MTSNSEIKQELRDEPSFLTQHWQKLVGLAFWLAIGATYFWYVNSNGLSYLDVVQEFVEFLRTPYGPILYIVLYALRPVIFFPASIITIAGGSIFGPVLGIIYVILGSNASASVAYLIGRYFGQGVLDEGESEGVIQKYAQRMRNNSFETILIMRFIFLPFDLVNYLGGFLRVDYKAFILATLLGSVPGTISFVLFGASFDISQGLAEAETNPWTLVASVVIFVVSLGLSRYLKKRETTEEEVQ